MLDSDEIQLLKQRKDFLLDILTHDIANVSQTLNFALDSIKKEDLINSDNWAVIKMAQDQNSRLKNLVSGAHTLLSIDSITQQSQDDRNFGRFIPTLFQKKQEKYPNFDLEITDISNAKDIKTDRTLETALELIVESIMELCSSDCTNVKTIINTDTTKKYQKIDFQFRSEGIKVNLIENYSQIDKSELVATATSPARINLIVANAIIQKNGGELTVTSYPAEKLNYAISISFPYYEDLE
jgi:light-regulated signal transduction histidine kinase (bacteriophytochrome)